jgi:hypothetical protein
VGVKAWFNKQMEPTESSMIYDKVLQGHQERQGERTRGVAKVNHVDKAVYEYLEVLANNRRTVYIKGKNNENQTNEVRQGGKLTSKAPDRIPEVYRKMTVGDNGGRQH